jgi:hypothetical protein
MAPPLAAVDSFALCQLIAEDYHKTNGKKRDTRHFTLLNENCQPLFISLANYPAFYATPLILLQN